MLFGRKVAIITADEVLEDAAFQFVPGRTVAAIDIPTIGNVILVVGMVINALIQGMEMGAYNFLHVCLVERTCIKS